MKTNFAIIACILAASHQVSAQRPSPAGPAGPAPAVGLPSVNAQAEPALSELNTGTSGVSAADKAFVSRADNAAGAVDNSGFGNGLDSELDLSTGVDASAGEQGATSVYDSSELIVGDVGGSTADSSMMGTESGDITGASDSEELSDTAVISILKALLPLYGEITAGVPGIPSTLFEPSGPLDKVLEQLGGSGAGMAGAEAGSTGAEAGFTGAEAGFTGSEAGANPMPSDTLPETPLTSTEDSLTAGAEKQTSSDVTFSGPGVAGNQNLPPITPKPANYNPQVANMLK